jgi:segregation and condensation protein A
MAEKLTVIDEETQKKYYRGYLEEDEVEKQATGEALKDVTLFDLMAAFRKVLADIKRQNVYHKVEKVKMTVEQQAEYVLTRLQDKGRTSFYDFCMELKTRTAIVVTFLAVLEMLKEQQINLFIEEDDPTNFHIDLKPVDEIIGDPKTTFKSEFS